MVLAVISLHQHSEQKQSPFSQEAVAAGSAQPAAVVEEAPAAAASLRPPTAASLEGKVDKRKKPRTVSIATLLSVFNTNCSSTI